MKPLLIALVGVFLILLVSELLWQKKVFKDEVARKFVHILVGSFVAFWPYFMSWRQIELMCLAFLLVVAASMRFRVFHAVHGVTRDTRGEIFFPIGIGLTALLAPSAVVFTAAILHLSLADGLAALVGKKCGRRHTYTFRGYKKSLAGTLTFFLTSLLIILAAVVGGGTAITTATLPLLILLPMAATVVENTAVGGTDNVFVPLLVVSVLRLARL